MRIFTRKFCYYYIDTNLLFSTVTNYKSSLFSISLYTFQNLSICFYYLCFIDILHGKEFNSKVISNTHFLVPPNITQYIKMLFHILKYMLFFIFRVFRTFKIKYLFLSIFVFCTISYELPLLILIYCVFYIYTCTFKVSAIIVFLLGLYYIKTTCIYIESDSNYKHVYMVSVQRSTTSLYCWSSWVHTVINIIIIFILYLLLYDILLHLFIIYENGSNHRICVTRVSIIHSFIMTRLRHNSVHLHIKIFDMGNDICLNVHVGTYQYIPLRLNDHLVSLCLTNIFEVTELNNRISVNTLICSYIWILFTLVRIVISLSLPIFILVNCRTVYLSHERYHKTVTCNRLYNTITIVSNHLRLPFNIMLLNMYYVALELYNRKYFKLILYIDIDCL